MSKLPNDEVQLAVKDLPGWRYFGNALHKEFRFTGFRAAITFVDRVAEQALTVRHYPDLELHDARVIVSLSTRRDGGVSVKDVALAQAIERVTSGAGTPSTAV